MTAVKSPKIKTRIGDVFLIPVDEVTWVVGQLVKKNRTELYVAVFEKCYSSTTIDPRNIIGDQPLFLVLTLDSKVYHGMWPIIGNIMENLSSFPEPAFKVSISGIAHIVSRDGSISRPASQSELEVLKLRSVRSPQGIENVIRSHFGILENQEDFEYYSYKYAEKTGKLL